MINPNDCPICFESISASNNCLTTECGHRFHSSCLFKNIALNGFNCPYCRSSMTDIVNYHHDSDHDSDNDSDDDSDSDDDDDDDSDDDYDNTCIFHDFALRGFRFFMNNIHGLQHDFEDISSEESYFNNLKFYIKPTTEFITNKLLNQGITSEDLVKVLLREHNEYDSDDDTFELIDDIIFDKISNIISSHKPYEQHIPIT